MLERGQQGGLGPEQLHSVEPFALHLQHPRGCTLQSRTSNSCTSAQHPPDPLAPGPQSRPSIAAPPYLKPATHGWMLRGRTAGVRQVAPAAQAVGTDDGCVHPHSASCAVPDKHRPSHSLGSSRTPSGATSCKEQQQERGQRVAGLQSDAAGQRGCMWVQAQSLQQACAAAPKLGL